MTMCDAGGTQLPGCSARHCYSLCYAQNFSAAAVINTACQNTMCLHTPCVMPFCWCLEPYNLRTAAGCHAGTVVKAGQAMVVLSAMKMETAVAAPCDGVVRHMAVAKGDTVDAGRDVFAQQTWAFVLPLLLE